METENTIINQLKAAVAAREDSLDALRGRLKKLIAPIPVGVVLADEDGEIGTIQAVCTGASQWANRTWMVTLTGKGLIAPNGKLACETCERSWFDGHNRHYHSTEPFCLDTDADIYDRKRLSWLSGRETRALALRLPRAIARYIEECKEETAANENTAEAIANQNGAV